MTPRSIVLSILCIAILCTAGLASPARAASACIDFGPPPPLGTTYGAPVGQVSGDLAFTASGIPVRVYNFLLSTGLWAFNKAYMDMAPVPFGGGQSIRTNNINLQFDFTGLPFRAKRVKLLFLDLGGYENLEVNGAGIYRGELTAAPPVLGGVSVAVSSSPLPPPLSGKTGTVVLTGTVKTLKIGGQELWLDQLCAE